MSKQAMFSLKLEAELHEAFMAEAEAAHRPASQIVREMMRDFIRRQRDKKAYDAYLHQKVETARASVEADRGRSHDEVEADFAARRAALLATTGGSEA